MNWKILDTGKNSAEKNMAIDAALLRGLAENPQPVLHFYEWEKPSATYGHFLDPYKYLSREAVREHGIQLARRPTGGGIVFHLTDFAFSVLIPANHPSYCVNTLDNYAFIHRTLASALGKFLGEAETLDLLREEPTQLHPSAKHFCMAGPTLNDVMLQGKKLAGGAQRRTRHGFLHQGTIALYSPDEDLLEMILESKTLAEEFRKTSFSTCQTQAMLSRDELKASLVEAFKFIQS